MKQPWQNKISMTVTESDVREKVRKHVKPLIKMGLIWHFSVTDTKRSTPGIPDDNYLIKCNGKLKYLMVECKDPQGRGRLKPGQKILVEFLAGYCHDYVKYIISNDADEIIREINKALEG